MNTNYAVANFLSLPVAELKQATQALIKSSFTKSVHERHNLLNDGNISSNSAVVVNPSSDGKNLKNFLNDLQSVFKEQRDEGLKSIVADQHKKGGSQGQSGNMQHSEEQGTESVRHRQCTLNDFLNQGNRLVCTDETALLDVLNTDIPLHLRQALCKATAAMPSVANMAANTLSLDSIEFDLQTLKLTLKIVCALEEVARMSSAMVNVQSSSRYYFDQSYMPYLYLLLFKSYALKEKLKKDKGRYSDSLYRKKYKDEQAQKENHMSMLL